MVSLLSPLVFVTPRAIAGETYDHDQEHRQYEAHAHGVAALNLVLEGDEVYMELDSPAANIVGFEHEPSSEVEHAALSKAVAVLSGDQLFRFNKEADCQMEKAMVKTAWNEEEHDDHEEEGEHDREDHGSQENEEEVHSDIEAEYHFECDQPDQLMRLTVELFEAFPATEKLNVQYIIRSKQGAKALTAKDHVVKF